MRSGELSFRAQRMSLPMLETFRLEIARISLCLEVEDKHQIGYTGARQYPKANEFIELKAKVTNLAGESLHACFRHGRLDGLSVSYCCHT